MNFKPRYIRINTLRLSAADAVRYFQDLGWNLVRCTAGSYNDFLKQVEKLGQYDFMPDYHVKVVFVFAPDTVFYDCELYHNNEIFLQDKVIKWIVEAKLKHKIITIFTPNPFIFYYIRK